MLRSSRFFFAMLASVYLLRKTVSRVVDLSNAGRAARATTALLGLLSFGLGIGCSPRPLVHRDAPPPPPKPLPERVAGANIRPVGDLRRGYGTYTARQTLARLKDLGVNTVAVLVEGRMQSADDTSVSAPSRQTLDRARAALEDARALDLATVVIPHLYVKDGTWRGYLSFVGHDARAETWWSSYQAFMERVGALAAAGQASALAIGVELKGMSGQASALPRFNELIGSLKKVYQGSLTYAANWDEAQDVLFWQDLDFVGVNAYYPLTPNPKTAAERIADDFAKLSFEVKKEVLVLEVGYRSSPNSFIKPWAWPEQIDEKVDHAAQASSWEAVLQSWLSTPQVRGLLVWVVPTDPDDPASEPPHGFNPLNKPAEAVIKRAFQQYTHPTLVEARE